MGGLRAARPEETVALRTQLLTSGFFDDDQHIEAVMRERPWRIQVTDASEMVLIDRWREHLDLAWIQGVFAEESRVSVLVTDACSIVAGLGYTRLLSPLVTGSAIKPYELAGMKAHQKVVEMTAGPSVLRRASRAMDRQSPVEVASDADLRGILRVDTAAFEPFWAFGEEQMRERSSRDRCAVVKLDGQVVGFALMSLCRGVGQLHRLAVMPRVHGEGIGSALLTEAVAWMGESGAEVASVNTQADNGSAQRLYRDQGFRRAHEALTMLISDRL